MMAMIDLLNAAKDKVDAEDMDRAMANEDTNKKLRELIVAANEEMRTKLTDKTTLSGLGDLAAELGAGEDLIAAASAGGAANGDPQLGGDDAIAWIQLTGRSSSSSSSSTSSSSRGTWAGGKRLQGSAGTGAR